MQTYHEHPNSSGVQKKKRKKNYWFSPNGNGNPIGHIARKVNHFWERLDGRVACKKYFPTKTTLSTESNIRKIKNNCSYIIGEAVIGSFCNFLEASSRF